MKRYYYKCKKCGFMIWNTEPLPYPSCAGGCGDCEEVDEDEFLMWLGIQRSLVNRKLVEFDNLIEKILKEK